MTEKLETLPRDAPLDDAAHRMLERGVHRLLVVETDKLVGVVSMTDLVRLIATGRLRDV
jgi:CBS domain-containing protein